MDCYHSRSQYHNDVIINRVAWRLPDHIHAAFSPLTRPAPMCHKSAHQENPPQLISAN